jgi:hypothetical protein
LRYKYTEYGAFVRTGAAIIILTGITLLILEKGISWKQLWFTIKLGLGLLLMLNGLLIGNKQGHKLREAVTAHADDFLQHTINIRESMNRFYPVQLALFFLIILTSVIRLDKMGSKLFCLCWIYFLPDFREWRLIASFISMCLNNQF